MRRIASFVLVHVVCLMGIAPRQVSGQWGNGLAAGTRVNADYTPNPNGLYRFYPNRSASNVFKFSVIHDESQPNDRRRIPLADPTIVQLNGTYYVTGTTAAAKGQHNFAIYKSQDLVNWRPHMLAFKEPDTATYSGILKGPFVNEACTEPKAYGEGEGDIILNGHKYRDLWAPQLYLSPATPNIVWLSFTARKGDDRVQDSSGIAKLPPRSVYCASIARTAFAAGGPTNGFATATWEPMPYIYLHNGQEKLDGGHAAGRPVPVSIDLTRTATTSITPSCGRAYCAGFFMNGAGAATYRHACAATSGGHTAHTAMSIDSFVYFDELDPANRRWMMYTWAVSDDVNWNGGHVAAHPMVNDRTMDPSVEPIALAYRFHRDYSPSQDPDCSLAANPNWPFVVLGNNQILNGTSRADAQSILNGCTIQRNFGIAEGPAAFSRNGRTYVMYSRNTWASPAYGIFYRQVQGTLAQASLPSYNNFSLPEEPLVLSAEPDQPYGASFGHGEVFKGPTVPGGEQKYYLIFHAKLEPSGTPTHPGVMFPRTIYFKELTFNPDGSIVPLSNCTPCDVESTEGFLIPHTN